MRIFLIFAVHYWGGVWYDHDAVFRMTRARCEQIVRQYPDIAECHRRLP